MIPYSSTVEVACPGAAWRSRKLDPPDFAFSEGGLLVRRAHHPELVEGHVGRTDSAHHFTVAKALEAKGEEDFYPAHAQTVVIDIAQSAAFFGVNVSLVTQSPRCEVPIIEPD